MPRFLASGMIVGTAKKRVLLSSLSHVSHPILARICISTYFIYKYLIHSHTHARKRLFTTTRIETEAAALEKKKQNFFYFSLSIDWEMSDVMTPDKISLDIF